MQIHASIHSTGHEYRRFPLCKRGQERAVMPPSPRTKDWLSVNQKPRVVYDGLCNLCTSAVRFLHALHGEQLVQYVPIQNLSSDLRRAHGLTDEVLQGQMYLIRQDGSLAGGPIALTEICKLLTPFSLICNLLGTPIARQLYDWIARRRYRIFGCRESCYVVK